MDVFNLQTKPCPFCQNPNAEDTGDACCFCDYEGEVTIGKGGMFKDIESYNKLYSCTNHEDRMDELHGRNDTAHIVELTDEY